MKQKDNNLTQFFAEYLTQRAGSKFQLNATSITMACWSALNDVDSDLNLAEVIFNMRSDFEYIYGVIDSLARTVTKDSEHGSARQQSHTSVEYFTIPEIASVYPISAQAVRKACRQGKLPFKSGTGKDKYLISKADMELYMVHAKGKNWSKKAN